MNFRSAGMGDLPQLKTMYKKIAEDMEKKGIRLWDEIYPYRCFKDDIENRRFYVLTDGETLAGALALTRTSAGAAAVKWKNGSALYIERFGVGPGYSGRGIGARMLQEAVQLAAAQGAGSLRLFAAEINTPAIGFYIKNGFTKAYGVYEEDIGGGFLLREFGFERALTLV